MVTRSHTWQPWLFSALAFLPLSACGARPAENRAPGEPVSTLAFDVDWPGVRASSMVAQDASDDEVRAELARIVTWRLAVLGLAVSVEASEVGLDVTLLGGNEGPGLGPAAASLASLGRCEILVEAPEATRAAEVGRLAAWRSEHPGRPLDDYNADPARPAPELAWFQPASTLGGSPDDGPLLLELPTTPGRAFGSGDFANATLTADRLGTPAIGFEIRDDRVSDFQAFTQASVGRMLVILVEGRVVVRATLMTKLGRSGIIEGHFEEAEARRMAQDLVPDRALLRPR
jgi:hypothetical protein